jgi:hypothetical protein
MTFRTPNTTQQELPPAGMAVGRCMKLIDLGTQHSEFYKKSSRKVILSFELPQLLHKGGNFDAQPFILSKRYTLSHNEKSTLRQDLESWYGRTFNTVDLNKAGGFDLERLLGRYALLNIVHTEDGQFANIKSINPLAQGMAEPRGYYPITKFYLDEFNQAAFESLSDNLREQIQRSAEYQELQSQGSADQASNYAGQPFPDSAGDLDDEESDRALKMLDDDDIPF